MKGVTGIGLRNGDYGRQDRGERIGGQGGNWTLGFGGKVGKHQ